MNAAALSAPSTTGPVAPAWDWPYSIAAETAQRLIDVHGVLLLERSEPAFWQDFQDRALQRLDTHIRQQSAWWREWLRLSPQVLARATLAQVPVLQRADFRASVESAGALPLPESHGGTAVHSTSGSSGVPATFHVSAWTARLIAGHYHADQKRHRLDLRQPLAALLARFAPHPGEPHRYTPPDPATGFGPVYARRSVGCEVAEHARWLSQLDPVLLHTSPAALSGLLEAWDAGIASPRRIKHVLTISETVSPQLRQDTRRVLGTRILDRYSCEEAGPIALQCPHDDECYHVCVSNVVVEVVDEAGKPSGEGQLGEVLVTGLHQWASPVIRLQLGDLARLHTRCTCGANVPALSDLLGRKRFLLRLPSGERVLLNVQARQLLAAAPVREYRLTQFRPDALRVEVVMDRPITQDDRTALVAALRDRVHPAFSYSVEQVDAIAWAPGGKRQELVCLL